MNVSMSAPARRGGSPARAGSRAQTDRPHLIEADDTSLGRRSLAQLEDAGRLLLVVGVGAGLPSAGALEGEASLLQQRPEVTGRDLDTLAGEEGRKPRQRPGRAREPLSGGG